MILKDITKKTELKGHSGDTKKVSMFYDLNDLILLKLEIFLLFLHGYTKWYAIWDNVFSL